MTDSLQTDNRSALQVAIEQAVDRELARIEQQAPLPGLFDGMQTPQQFLVSLAIERGIVDWSEADTLAARRMTARDAMTLHRLSCSREGIKRSIETLGFDARTFRVRPYVLGVEAELSDVPLTEELQERVARRVDVYRAGRDSIELSLVLSCPVPVHVAVAINDGDELDVYPWQNDDIDVLIQGHAAVTDTIFDEMDTYPWST